MADQVPVADPVLGSSPLPAGSVLLHIGPYKTGSTALQTALFDAREELRAHGVAYPGRWRRAKRPGWAVLGYTPRGRRAVPIAVWEDFAAQVRGASAAGLRCCVSTEDFGSAGPLQVQRIVQDLGGEQVHVVAVARRLDRLLTSQWQERVKGHATLTREAWLERVLGDDEGDPEHRTFWASHDVVRMFGRWEPTVGRERFRLVILDESDPSHLPRCFEQLLGVPAGTLRVPPRSNSSLSAQATELLRQLNEVFEDEKWSDATYHRLIQRGLLPALVGSPPDQGDTPIPPLPRWAATRARELSARRVDAIRERGILVAGELGHLLMVDAADGIEAADVAARAGSERHPAPDVVSLRAAVDALAGIVEAAAAALGERGHPRNPTAPDPGRRRHVRREPTRVDDLSSAELLRTVGRRAVRRLGRSPGSTRPGTGSEGTA